MTTENVDDAACERALAYIRMMRRGYELSHIVFVFPFVKDTRGEKTGDVWKDPAAMIAGAISKDSTVRRLGDNRAYSISLPGLCGLEFAVKHHYMKIFRQVRCLTIHERKGKYICKIPHYMAKQANSRTVGVIPVPRFHQNNHLEMSVVSKLQSVAAELSVRRQRTTMCGNGGDDGNMPIPTLMCAGDPFEGVKSPAARIAALDSFLKTE